MPKMGEGIMEATIIKWLKKEGDSFEEGDSILEIATDKVDSEVPAPHSGKLEKILASEGAVIATNNAIAIINTNNEIKKIISKTNNTDIQPKTNSSNKENILTQFSNSQPPNINIENRVNDRFYSPLVKKIATEAGVSQDDLAKIPGSGTSGRLTKNDIQKYIQYSNSNIVNPLSISSPPISPGDELLEMDRVRKLISKKMVITLNTIPQVTSFVEADVTNVVEWKTKNRDPFYKKYELPLTYTPILIEAIIKALKEFPLVNSYIMGDKIIKKKAINIGMAVNLPNNNLIVPVIKHADKLNLKELTHKISDLSKRARSNNLKPSEIAEATYSISNIGTFNSLMGTPIITPPQVAVMALGAIKNKPDVVKTEKGSEIAIRSKIILSHTYDHRIIDGAMGGNFANQVAVFLEDFDLDRKI